MQSEFTSRNCSDQIALHCDSVNRPFNSTVIRAALVMLGTDASISRCADTCGASGMVHKAATLRLTLRCLLCWYPYHVASRGPSFRFVHFRREILRILGVQQKPSEAFGCLSCNAGVSVEGLITAPAAPHILQRWCVQYALEPPCRNQYQQSLRRWAVQQPPSLLLRRSTVKEGQLQDLLRQEGRNSQSISRRNDTPCYQF